MPRVKRPRTPSPYGDQRQLERELKDARDRLVAEVQERLAELPGDQWQWATTEWLRLYPSVPRLVRWRVYDQLTRSFDSLLPSKTVKKPRTTAETSKSADSSEAASNRESGRPKTISRPGVGRQERLRREQALRAERDKLFLAAQRRFDDVSAQATWAMEQWEHKHPRYPDLVDKRVFRDICRTLSPSSFRQALDANTESLTKIKGIQAGDDPQTASLSPQPADEETPPSTDVPVNAQNVATNIGEGLEARPVADIPSTSVEVGADGFFKMPEGVFRFPPLQMTIPDQQAEAPDEFDEDDDEEAVRRLNRRRRTMSRRVKIPDVGPMPELASTTLKLVIGKGGNTETFSGLACVYLIQKGLVFHALEPKATVHAFPESEVYSEGSRVIRYPGATVHGPCEDAEVDEEALEDSISN